MPKPEQKENAMKYKLAYTGLILLIYIIGKCIPLYGIDLSDRTYQAISAEEVLILYAGDFPLHDIQYFGTGCLCISQSFLQITRFS